MKVKDAVYALRKLKAEEVKDQLREAADRRLSMKAAEKVLKGLEDAKRDDNINAES